MELPPLTSKSDSFMGQLLTSDVPPERSLKPNKDHVSVVIGFWSAQIWDGMKAKSKFKVL